MTKTQENHSNSHLLDFFKRDTDKLRKRKCEAHVTFHTQFDGQGKRSDRSAPQVIDTTLETGSLNNEERMVNEDDELEEQAKETIRDDGGLYATLMYVFNVLVWHSMIS
ncbi:hypothetical protein Glove_505g34 [Diversispora epigaea]|uniref:Uncharacterized protein n=1 Tax=Diversispora epigaea TaxID=1348612 RepID=A0A397GK33_9GLOM|nr:hypothetical protein Glove_505g34 [Diversispora epigaea]